MDELFAKVELTIGCHLSDFQRNTLLFNTFPLWDQQKGDQYFHPLVSRYQQDDSPVVIEPVDQLSEYEMWREFGFVFPDSRNIIPTRVQRIYIEKFMLGDCKS